MKNILILTFILFALTGCSSLTQNRYKSAVLIEITPEIKSILFPYKPNNDEKIREAISRLKIISSRKNLDLLTTEMELFSPMKL